MLASVTEKHLHQCRGHVKLSTQSSGHLGGFPLGVLNSAVSQLEVGLLEGRADRWATAGSGVPAQRATVCIRCCPWTCVYSIYRYLGPEWGSDWAGGVCQPLGLMVGGRSDAVCTWCHPVPRVFSLCPPTLDSSGLRMACGGRKEQSPFGG